MRLGQRLQLVKFKKVLSKIRAKSEVKRKTKHVGAGHQCVPYRPPTSQRLYKPQLSHRWEMPKRSKNSTDGAVFTYHERRKMDHGTSRRRLPGGALKSWDHCALGLTTPSDPVITPQGVLYEREAILRELLRQRNEARRAREEAEEERRREQVQLRKEERAKELKEAETFERKQQDIIPSASEKKADQVVEKTVDSSFWLPDAKPKGGAEKKKETKVSLKTRCPISKKSLRAKDLISIKLKPVVRDEGSETSSSRFECPVCQTRLTNALKPVALRTGTVLCCQCVSKFALKEQRDPVTSTCIDVKADVIPIFNVGTAFAGSVANQPSSLEAELYRPSVR